MFRSTCPACDSAQIRRTRRHALERVLLPFAAACRCNECGHRFYSVSRAIRHQTDSFNVIEIHRAPKSRTASIP
ncbi:hypothetical protein GCM10011507_07670 [Edaphobacter acidisoli]|uniref:C2H2-type domain-containing protein n=1 Tax=Edaphobacter acidisoli TaxID=2040573 RepID=A0A916W0X6_9BACT|nr:hypothetical protein [Edaphobacter acidisoli]GGA58758.1 hypothetical protein GCM10011507_07670 [Edaphobacter acidisoli]